MTAAESRHREAKLLDAGGFQPEISSFRLQLAAEGKAAKTVRTYTEAVRWFAAAHLRRQASCTRWEQVSRPDVQRWIVWLLERYSSAYASNQYRALQQFFRWLAAEEEFGDPMDGMRPPRVPGKPVPVFTGEDLSRLERACAGRSFHQRRDAAVIAVFRATDPGCQSWRRSGMTAMTRGTATSTWSCGRSPSMARGRRPGLSRSASGRPQRRPVPPRPRQARPGLPAAAVARGRQPRPDDRQRHLPDDRQTGPRVRRRCVPAPVPASFQPYLAGPRRPRGRPDGAQRLVLSPDAPPLRCQRPQRQSPPHLRPHHGRQHLKTPRAPPATPAPGASTGQAGACALLHRAAGHR
jgi:hypothetical protein